MRVRDTKKVTKMMNLPPLPEVTWEVTFENESTVFIAARDEAHARRIIENNGLWRRTPECEPTKHVIKSIKLV